MPLLLSAQRWLPLWWRCCPGFFLLLYSTTAMPTVSFYDTKPYDRDYMLAAAGADDVAVPVDRR